MGAGRQISGLLDEAVSRLVQQLHPERVYLFGSQARGDAGPDSDYDLMVIVPQSDRPRYARAWLAYEALYGIGVPIEVLVLTREEFDRDLPVATSLPATVNREGQLLYAA